MILVSACLIGINCKYNGDNNESDEVKEYLKDKRFVPICPEQLGGLSTPRIPSEIVGGDGINVLNNKAKVIDKNGKDVTFEFIKGATESLKIAQLYNCKEAILKANSPSCSNKYIYSGKFDGSKIDGLGVTTALFKQYGVRVISEKEI